MATFPFTRFIAITAVCLLADKLPSSAQIVNISIPDSSFSTDNSGSSYANQYPVDYSPYPTAEIFADWATSSYNYQIFQESTAGQTGTFDGTTAVQVNFPYGPSGFTGPGAIAGSQNGSTTESLNPVVASIANNAIYTLTFSLANVDGTAGNVTLSMLSTTSAPDTTNYGSNIDPATNQPYGPNPTPTITTQETFASVTIPGAVINAQAAGQFTDYSVSFSTVDGFNSTYVGQDLTLAINVQGGASTDFDNARLTETIPLAAPPAANLYYDTNGATAGTNTTGSSNLTDSVWTIDPTGSSVTTGFVAGSNIIFSAGTNGTGAQNVTVTDAESVNGIVVNNGTVTLLGSGSPSLSIGDGGITNNSTDGPTTLDSSLGTVQVAAGEEQWNNDSSQALNINSGVTSAGGAITFDGTGTGATNLNGLISGGLALTDESSTSIVNLNNGSNSFSGLITINGGTLNAGSDGALGNGNSILLENGGTIGFGSSGTHNIVLGVGGGSIYSGVVGGGIIDNFYSGTITQSGPTSGPLDITGGDFIPDSNDPANNAGTINVEDGRMLLFGGGILSNNAVVNVSSGAILDFRINGTYGNAITLASGSALETRVSNQTLTDVTLPTAGTVTLGSDDEGFSTMTIQGPAINLSGPLEIDTNTFVNSGTGTQPSTVYLENQITGSGNMTFGAVNQTSPYDDYSNNPTSSLVLTANNTYSGTTTLNPITWTDGGNPAVTDRANLNISLGTSGFSTSSIISNGANMSITNGGTMANNFTINNSSNLTFATGSSDLNLTGAIEMAGTNEFLGIGNQTNSNLNVGNITFDKVVGNSYNVYFDASGTGAINLVGTYISPVYTTDQTTGNFGPPSNGGYGPSALNFGVGGEENANYNLTSSANFTNMAPLTETGIGSIDGTPGIVFFSGNLNIDNSTWVPGQLMAVQDGSHTNHTINIEGSQDVNLGVYVNLYNNPGTNGWTINQATADASTWAGAIQMNGYQFTLGVTDGGRLTVNALTSGTSSLSKTGNGTLVLPNASNYVTDGSGPSFDIKQGTVLITNTTGSAFGSSSGNTVQIEAGATLGGNGFATQMVVAMDPTSVIAPGDAGQKNLGINPSIGILNLDALNEGITANSGLTLDFKLDGDTPAPIRGTDNDLILVYNLTLNGPVTVNLTAIDALVTGLPYELIQGIGDWSGSIDPTFTVNTPQGYALDPTYGTGGYLFDTTFETLSIQLIAVPEPASYGLLLLSVGTLTWFVRRRHLA